MAWDDLDINNDTFSTANMVVGYKDGISYQLAERIAQNTSYLFRRTDNRVVIVNQRFYPVNSEFDYDTDRDYLYHHIMAKVDNNLDSAFDFSSEAMDFERLLTYAPRLIQLTSSYQSLFASNILQIKALAFGGFRIKNTDSEDRYVCAIIEEVRTDFGSWG